MHQKKTRLLVLALLGVALVITALIDQQRQQQHSIQVALKWSNLTSLPSCAHKPQLTTTGNMMSREFHLEFQCSPEQIRAWMETQKILAQAKKETQGSSERYKIPPGAGAQGAELIVNWPRGFVQIYCYWS